MSEQIDERWAKIEGYDVYEVSSEGLVRSLKFGRVRYLKPTPSDRGYLRVGLAKGERTNTLTIHRLVLAAFVPNPDGKPQVNHKNGIKADNRLCNLEWATSKENNHHASVTGLAARGERHGRSKNTDADVLRARELYASGQYSLRQLASMFGVAHVSVGRWVNLASRTL